MRLRLVAIAALSLLCGAVLAAHSAAQNPDTMMPEESATKAKQILQQLIDALGGQTYLSVHDSDCTGRLAQFGHNGDLTGYEVFRDYWHYPDKNRTDYDKKGNIIDLFNGDQGWSMDRGGVSEMPAPQVADFQEQVKTDIDNLLRLRLHEEGLTFRYGGPDIVDLKQVDWVEIGDTDRRTFRLAVDQLTHLLVRSVVITRDETTRERTTETTYYSNYQPRDGVLTPLQVTRTRDGRRIYQVFYDTCKYNPGLSPEMFTKAALDQRFAEVGGGKKKDRDRKKDKDRDKD